MSEFFYASLPPKAETVSECVARLGPPPDDIAGEWIDEATELTGQNDLVSFDPEAELWKTIYVGTDGRLHTDPPSPVQLSVVNSEVASENSNSDSTEQPTQQPTRLAWSRWFLAPVALVVLAGVWWLIPNAIPNANEPKLASQPIASPSAMSLLPSQSEIRRSRRPPSTEPIAFADDELGSDEQLDLVIDEVDAFETSPPTGLAMELSLDSFLPPSPIEPATESKSQPDTSPEPTSDGEVVQPSTATADNVLGEAITTDILSSDDEEDQSEMLEDADEQATSRRDPIEPQVSGVSLPSPPRRTETKLPESVSLLAAGRIPNGIELQMPPNSNANFELRKDTTSNATWQIVASRDASPIAEILGDAGAEELRLAWLDGSREVLSASTLSQGRLITSDGDMVYLRPRLDTETIKLTLAKRDLKLKWSLQTPVPPKATEIRVLAKVPKDVELTWIEPIVSASPRKTRGVALLRLKTSESTAIVVRMDIKTTNSLSLRLRFGARLDPAMPWQWTDAQSIRESFEAVTKQLEVADAQLLNLDVAISRAKRIRARRQEYLLEEQRDRIDEAVKVWAKVAKRLAELDQLVAFLDAGASLSPELVVRWDDGEQVILGVPAEPTTEPTAE